MENEIFQTKNFIVEAHPKPFIPRQEGGHIRIKVKDTNITDRTKLDPTMAIELIRLTMVVGSALENVMNKIGIPVIKINYQDMGNWAWKTNTQPFLHVHVFGRATNAVKQPWPESMYLPDRGTGFYDGFEPLNENDIKLLKAEIEKIFTEEKYQDKHWYL